MKRLLRYRQKTVEQLEGFWTKHCEKCEEVKPARTHHCRTCNRCVFLMDHHCPWINNCVGLENQRYFLLFVLYTFVGACYMVLTIKSVWHHHAFKAREHKDLLNFCVIIDFALAAVMFGFSVWNWFLAAQGNTTIEFMTGYNGMAAGNATLRFDSVSDNLYRVFGTHKWFRILSPSMRNVPFTGLEWSFWFKDEGYDCNGKVVDTFDEESESIIANQNVSAVEMTELN